MPKEQTVRVAGRMLRITNLDKVLYPATGTTKGEVIDYITRIAPVMIPHLTGRPVTRKRWPDGVGTAEHPGKSFFTKDLERGAPEWIHRMPIEHATGVKEYPLADDLPTLVSLAQMAALELHVPQWRFATDGGRRPPDRLVLDLDPGPGAGLAECAEVARLVREILSGMGLDPVPVTSGSKGIHLYAALPGTQTSEEVTAVAKALAQALEADHPDLVVSSMKRALREGKVLLDWSQNNGSKTTVAPYSLRGRLEPWVAAPRTWEELDDPDLRQLLFAEVLERVEDSGDPMAALGFHAGGRGADSGPLAAYIAKRTAGRTPEPVPADAHPEVALPPGELPRFVVQEHHATRLHWDLRLERDGVLVSWAVPRGIPETATRNNLAIMTEDHPLEYAEFAGTIPKGQYGAGTMTIWDEGRYELEKWRDDEVIFTLEGQPGGPLGRVRLALIRTQGEGEKSQWLLHRMKSDAAGAPQRDGGPVAASVQADGPPLQPMLSTRATPGLARAAATRWTEDGPAWAEMKWDGVRALAVWDGSRLRLRARTGSDITAKYPELTAVSLSRVEGSDPGFGGPCIVDGEIVALDARGRPSFPLLQKRINLTKKEEIAREMPQTPVRYLLFDALSRDGEDLRPLPLAERRVVLEEIGAHVGPPFAVPAVFDDVDDALEESRRLGLEGIVVKNPRSAYSGGERSENWLKVKFLQTQEVVIGGMRTGKESRASTFGSLLLGIPDDGCLRYVGRVGTGFSDRALADLRTRLDARRRKTSPFVEVPDDVARDAVWVRPDLVGEVEFAEFTPDGVLRHARWRGIRSDKRPEDVRREAP